MIAFVTEIEPKLTQEDKDAWLRRLDREYPLIRSLIDSATRQAQYEDALRLSAPLWQYWLERDLLGEGRHILLELLTHAREIDERVLALALHASGTLAFHDGFTDTAARHLQEAHDIWQRLGEYERARRTQSHLAMVANRVGDTDTARSVLSENIDAASLRSTIDRVDTPEPATIQVDQRRAGDTQSGEAR